MSDYRNTEYCPILENIEEKKETLEKSIQKKHPRQKIMYNKVRDRDTIFNREFCSIYNYKCAYCGVSMDILSSTLFEVDHFKAESLFGDNKTEAGKVDNLVLACYQCNRNKKEFNISGAYLDKLNPDNGNITEVFVRDDKYYIRIKECYKNDESIIRFYEKIKFYHQTRRLDYLLLNMNGLQKDIEGTKKGEKLAEAILTLQRKRNRFAERN